jgi:hypothetical protein
MLSAASFRERLISLSNLHSMLCHQYQYNLNNSGIVSHKTLEEILSQDDST